MKCARCGHAGKLISGIKCAACGHVHGMQNLDTDWRQHSDDLGRKRARNADDQNRPHRPAGDTRRNPLRFEED
jgi:ribosomal protein L37E